MLQFETINGDERGSADVYSLLIGGFVGVTAITLFYGLSGYGPTFEDLTQVQQHNAQLAPIIEEQYPNETNLIVSPDDESFTFTAVDKDGKTLRCYASFESDGAAVTSVGPIVCESIVIDLDQ